MFKNKNEGLLNAMELKKAKYRLLYALMIFSLIILSLVCLLPTIWVFLSGFKTNQELYRIPPTFIPSKFEFGNVAKIWNIVNFGSYFKNTLILIVGALLCDIIFNGLCGYVLSKIKPKGTPLLETLIFWSMLLPGISMVPLYMSFVDVPFLHVNLTGSFVPLWLMTGCNAFNVLLFRNFFNGIPNEYMEAAKIDGCSDIKFFSKIIIPLSKPIIVVVTIFSVTASWSNFMWPYLILNNTTKETISILLYNISSSGKIQQNGIMMLTTFSIIPPAIMYALFSRHILGGITMAGIKG